ARVSSPVPAARSATTPARSGRSQSTAASGGLGRRRSEPSATAPNVRARSARLITPFTLAGDPGGADGGVDARGDGGADLGQVGVAGDVGGHGVDEVAEGAQPDAGLDGGGGGGGAVHLAVELDDADRAEHPDAGDAGAAGQAGQAGAESGLD